MRISIWTVRGRPKRRGISVSDTHARSGPIHLSQHGRPSVIRCRVFGAPSSCPPPPSLVRVKYSSSMMQHNLTNDDGFIPNVTGAGACHHFLPPAQIHNDTSIGGVNDKTTIARLWTLVCGTILTVRFPNHPHPSPMAMIMRLRRPLPIRVAYGL